MGAGAVGPVVADSGPLIHLAEVGLLGLLRMFEAVHAPGAVWSETVGKGLVNEADLMGLGNVCRRDLRREDVREYAHEHGLEALHDGELESLCLCRMLGVFTLLTDDLAVRKAAKRLGITPVGSLGVVVRAHKRGAISVKEAENAIVQLYDLSSLFVTRAIVDLVIDELRKSSSP